MPYAVHSRFYDSGQIRAGMYEVSKYTKPYRETTDEYDLYVDVFEHKLEAERWLAHIRGSLSNERKAELKEK